MDGVICPNKWYYNHMNKIQIQQAIAEVIHESPGGENIQSISLFGSYLHGNVTSESDVDLFFEIKNTMSLFQIGGLQYRLQEKLGLKVDFVPKNSVISQLKRSVILEAEIIYERK